VRRRRTTVDKHRVLPATERADELLSLRRGRAGMQIPCIDAESTKCVREVAHMGQVDAKDERGLAVVFARHTSSCLKPVR
jgi:hypothetical protein